MNEDRVIDPYYQHRKCSAETLVCKDISRGIIGGGQVGPKAQTKMCSAKRPTPTRVATSLLDVFNAILMPKQFVCTSMLPLGSSPPPLQFDVSFPAKLLKIVATRGEIFSLKFTKYRVAAGLCPDPLGELKRSPGPTSRNKGAYF